LREETALKHRLNNSVKGDIMKLQAILAGLSVLALSACATAQASSPQIATAAQSAASTTAIVVTQADIAAAQRAWGNALVQISTDFEAGGLPRAKATAGAVLDGAYGYNLGPVLFKPTLTEAPQTFRTTREGALAYFVGDNPAFPRDTGFALKGWRTVVFTNAATFINGDVALSMGNVSMTDKNGAVTTVDKTFGYKKGADGTMRIVLHHSSLPYKAP
jgi:hypothetical protein